jgi:putative transcription antitermination factor YqgF
MTAFALLIMTKYYLGLDWGKSKIGVALADGETRLAFGYAVWKNDASFPGRLRGLAKEYPLLATVIGVPSHAGQASSEGEIRRFGARLEKSEGMEVFYFQEMFTTRMAQANRMARGRTKDGWSDDQEAARIILQEWLDMNGGLG